MKTFKKEKVAVYCRVSSEDQAERSTIDVQKEFAANYIKLYQLELVDYYCDNGISGTVPMKKRPEGSRLLKDAADRRFDIVLFYKLDRIGRKTTVILDALQTLTDLDVTIRSMTEPLDTNTPTGKFIITTFSGMAELDRDSTLIRLHAGALVAAKKGKWLGGIVPFGYLTDKDGWSALLYAVRYSESLAVVNQLLEAGADAKLANKYASSPLLVAVSYNNNPKILSRLIDYYGSSDKELLKAFVFLSFHALSLLAFAGGWMKERPAPKPVALAVSVFGNIRDARR